jgi:separase
MTKQPDLGEVLQPLSSLSSCSAATVISLLRLLEDPVESPNGETSSSGSRKPPKTSSRNASSRKIRPVSRDKTTTTAPVQILCEEPKALSSDQRLLLATRAFNQALKSLSDAAKLQTSQEDAKPPHREKTKCAGSPNEPQITVKPLQTRSPNKSRGVTRRDSSASISQRGNLSGANAVAECAHVALDCIRRLGKKKSGFDTQLESGALSLISKCISLGAYPTAVRELRAMHQRIQTHVVGKQNKNSRKDDDSKLVEKDTLPDLLNNHGCIPEDGEILQLLTSMQCHAVRIIAIRKKPAEVNGLRVHLDFEKSDSLLSLLKLQASKNGEQVVKVVRNIETISNSMLSVCPSVSSSADSIIYGHQTSIPPEICFSLQTRALLARIQCWRLSANDPKIESQIWSPFSRYMAAYDRRCSSTPDSKYQFGKSCFTEVLSSLKDLKIQQLEETPAPSKGSAYRILSKLAQDASRLQDAIEWVQQADLVPRARELSSARKATTTIRLATLMLQGSLSEQLEPQLRSAHSSLIESLKGDPGELDALLLEVVGLRKSLINVFLSQRNSADVDQSLRGLYMVTVFGCVRFILRYLGVVPSETATEESISRYNERLLKSLRSAAGFIDSVLLCAKSGIQERIVEWESLDTAFQDCSALALRLTSSEVEEVKTEKTINVDRALAKLSSLYWAYYIQHNHSSSGKDTITALALQRSIEILSRGGPEARRTGLIATKLEALAGLHDRNGAYREASECLRQLFNQHVQSGAVESTVNSAAILSYDKLWKTSDGLALSRCIDRYHSITSKAQTSGLTLSELFDSNLEDEAKGMVLERQLQLYCEQILKPKSVHAEGQVGSIVVLLRSLFSLYQLEAYPVRRLRCALLTSLLFNHLSEGFPEDIVHAVHQARDLESDAENTKDKSLAGYSNHLRNGISVNLALQNPRLSFERMEKSIQLWQRFLENPQSSLQDQIDYMPIFVYQLTLLADFLDVQCLPRLRIPTLSLLSCLLEALGSEYFSALVETLVSLTLQYLHLGYSGKAGLTLAKCQNFVENASVTPESKATYHLASLEYFISIGTTSKCEEHIAAAELVSQQCQGIGYITTDRKQMSSSIAVKSNRLLAMALDILSRFDLQAGNPHSALKNLKRGVKLLQRCWVFLENSGTRPSSPNADIERLDADGTVDNALAYSRPPITSMTHDALNGARLWCLVAPLRRSYSQMSALYAHLGMFSEALSWVEKVGKLVDATPSPPAKLWYCTLMADIWFRAGEVETGQKYLDEAAGDLPSHPSLELAQYHRTISKMWKMRGELDDEVEALDVSLSIVEKLHSQANGTFDRISGIEEDIVECMTKMKLDETTNTRKATTKPRARAIKKPTAKAPPKKTQRTLKSSVAKSITACSPDSSECIPILAMKAQACMDKALVLIRKDDISGATSALGMVEEINQVGEANLRQKVVICQRMIQEAIKGMSLDCTFSMLAESTISIPSVATENRESEQGVKKKSSLRGKQNPTKQSQAGKATTSGKSNKKSTSASFKDLLWNAHECLSQTLDLAAQLSSSAAYRGVSHLLLNATFYISAAFNSCSKELTNPTDTALLLDKPLIRAERDTLSATLVSSEQISKTDLTKWPSKDFLLIRQPLPSSTTQFQEEFIDIIPESWTAVSLSLSESQDELYISRYRAGESPFVLRVPLTSHNNIMDDEQFGFEDGKSELLEIIDLSNTTTKASRYIDSKQGRTDWWNERENLNTRMKNLLLNIEKIWLGGFRGIFTRQQHQPILLARFQKTMQNSLNRHLPSRNGKGKKKNVNLDSRILELFIALGDPNKEMADIDESIIDLLYFVVDILQFNGECNAYDEIDFDALVVETLDALKAFHSASIEGDTPHHHTILILDKELHCFPWESMPVLIKQNVSRLPSLEALRTRIIASRQNSRDNVNSDCVISRSAGASLLNPSGDLKNTQLAMEPLLSSLSSSWTHLPPCIGPSENQLEETLSSHSIFLYFGHGSGNQFIRTRTVRSLKRPAPVTWLMGCSSAALTTRGEFEPEGMVAAYVAAGSPAVVGTLWDVTDKDCDRAAVKAGESWGLWDVRAAGADCAKVLALKGRQKKAEREIESSRGAVGSRSAKGKGRIRGGLVHIEETERSERVNLVEAIKLGRDECYLRYLNGAALVVYGIPVMLDS